jgi:16S rRNA (guanine527-N7)-methyltransferase
VAINDGSAARLAKLARLISTSPHNLVSRRDRASVGTAHVPEALGVGALLDPGEGQRWLDLGTGGGLPGLVLAIAYPATHFVLVDSTRKKIEAVREFAAGLGLDNVVAIAERAEVLAHDPAHRGSYDGVVARAVAPLPILAELARGFVAPGGVLGAVKGPDWEAELARAERSLAVLGWRDAVASHVASATRPTWLVRMRAEGAPPRGYPRRTGVPRQDPIGGRPTRG